jgi:DNA gyrase subunit A
VKFVGVRDGDSVVALALYPEVTEAEVEAAEAEAEAETGGPDVVSEAAESGVPEQVLEAEESQVGDQAGESALADEPSDDPAEDDSIE